MLTPNQYWDQDTNPYYLTAFNKQGEKVANHAVNEKELPNHVGKEIADKLLSTPPNKKGERMISGANLVTGDKSMKKFYDEKVPNILNSIGKKYGVKTQVGGFELKGKGRELTDEEHRQALRDAGHDTNPMTLAQQREFDYEQKKIPAHYFPITEEMRQDVKKNGIPLYVSGGSVKPRFKE